MSAVGTVGGPEGQAVLEAVRQVAASVAPCVDEIERSQALPAHVVEGLVDAGVFSLYLPSSLGGGGDPVTAYRVCEELARVDGSVAWCAMVAITTAYLVGWLDHDVAAEMFGSPADARLAGSTRPLGVAVADGDVFRVTGRWDVASGVGHANWVIAACRVQGGAAAPGEAMRVAFVPVEHIEVIPTWDVLGMRGTGSHDVVIDSVAVPASHTTDMTAPAVADDVLFHPRLMRVTSHAPVAGVVLGLASGAIDTLAGEGATTTTTGSSVALRDRARVQHAVAEATAEVEAARAFVVASTAAACDAVAAGEDPARHLALARLSYVQAARAAKRAVQLVFDAAGTSAVHRGLGLERRYRDLAVACQFKSFDPEIEVGAGRVLLGLDPEGAGW